MYTRRRSWKRKSQRRPWLLIILLIIAAPIGLELLARLIANMTGLDAQLSADPSKQEELVQAYRLGFMSPSGQPYTTLPIQGGALKALRSPLMGYQLLPKQTSQFWTINPQGFRDDDPVPVAKPAGEVRIFVLGGSTAFGQLNSSNAATFASQLEKLLNDRVSGQRSTPNRFQPGVLPYRADEVEKVLALPPRIPERTYRVINAAVPGYASGNELAQLIQQVANYNPDMLVVLDSYADLMLPSSQKVADIPGLDAAIEGKREDLKTEALHGIQDWFNQMYLVRGVQHYILQSPRSEQADAIALNIMTAVPNQSLDQSLPSNGTELDRRVARYRDHLLQMVRWSSASRDRLFVGIQPEITSRKADTMPPEESAILAKLGSNYAERVQTGYDKLSQAATQVTKSSANAKLLDLSSLYATFSGQAFQSPTSLTDEANKALADRFFQAIVNELAIEPKPYGS
jgi:hypothetical protein